DPPLCAHPPPARRPPGPARLKGAARPGELLARALDARIGVPEPVGRLQTDGRFVSIPGADIAALLAESRERRLPYLARREVFRRSEEHTSELPSRENLV